MDAKEHLELEICAKCTMVDGAEMERPFLENVKGGLTNKDISDSGLTEGMLLNIGW
jgi:hypothetical protein